MKSQTLGNRSHRLTNRHFLLLVLVPGVIFALDCLSSSHPQGAQFDWKPVEQALGKAGSLQPDGVYKVGLPRADLHVKVGDL
jgi:hypothetical protein